MKLYGIIYKATAPSGRAYIGQTTFSLASRVCRHRRRATCRLLHNAIAKYGDAMRWEEIACAWDRAGLDYAECALIAQHGTTAPRGYNIKAGGSHGKHSAETRAKIGAGSRKNLADPDFYAAHCAMMRSVNADPDKIQRAAVALSGQKRAAETKAKMSKTALSNWANAAFRARFALNRRLFHARRRTPIGACLPLV